MYMVKLKDRNDGNTTVLEQIQNITNRPKKLTKQS